MFVGSDVDTYNESSVTSNPKNGCPPPCGSVPSLITGSTTSAGFPGVSDTLARDTDPFPGCTKYNHPSLYDIPCTLGRSVTNSVRDSYTPSPSPSRNCTI